MTNFICRLRKYKRYYSDKDLHIYKGLMLDIIHLQVGRVSEDFTTIGIILAILFFPLGILCCLMMKEKKCDRCGAKF